MSNTISGGISFSGIGGGTDFNEVIDKLYELESIRLNGLQDSREEAMESYEAMSEIIAAVTEAKEALSLLNSPSKFLLKLAASSDETVATATADYKAVDGTFTVDVEQLAANSIWASKNTYDSKTASVNTSGTQQTLTYTYDGVTRNISVPPNTTLEGLAHMINEDKANPGVSMQLVKTASGYTFQVAGNESGQGKDIEIIPNANIVGFSSSNSVWESYPVAHDATLNGGQATVTSDYNLTLWDNTSFSVSVDSDTTNQGLVDAINEKYDSLDSIVGNDIDIAEIDADGNLVIDGLRKFEAPAASVAPSKTMSSVIEGSSTVALDAELAAGTYVFENDNVPPKSYTVEVPAGETWTVQEVLTDLNTQITSDPDAVEFQINAAANSSGGTDYTLHGFSSVPTELGLDGIASVTPDYSAPVKAGDAVTSGTIPNPVEFNITFDDGTSQTFSVDNSLGYQGVVDAINGIGGAGTAQLVSLDPADPNSSQKLVLNGVASLSSTSSAFNANVNFGGSVTASSNFTIQTAQNAEFKINNFEHTLTSSTNTVTDVIEGVTLSLKSVGETQIGVASDTDSVKANIQTVLDSINSVLLKVKDLTSVTEEPSATYTDDATLTVATLSGEYSVLSFQSRMKNEVTGNPAGFNNIVDPEDIFSGDFIATLSQMGIKTVSDADDPNFGLFAIAPSGSTEEIQALDQKMFDDAIANNLNDVINFFAADDSGTTSSDDFGYSNHIDGITEPGTYDVKYTVTGGVVNVTINGTPASPSDVIPNTYTVGGDGPESGLSITLYDLAEGEHEGTVSIQRGIVSSMESFFEAEMKFFKTESGDDPTLSQNNGGLMIAQNSYQELIDSIDNQISNEMDRLERWEYNERMKYARLDTLLGEYNGNMSVLNNQLAQLG